MDTLLVQCSTIIRKFYTMSGTFRIDHIKQMFDDIIFYLNKIPYQNRKTDGMYILTIICEQIIDLNIFRLLDHLILRNHSIFIYIARTFEMLLTKSNHLQTMIMTKQEENCFYATSHLIAQLCLYQNEPVELFYGKISSEIFQITDKPNPRDENINKTSREKRKYELMEKPNLKTSRLPSTAPPSRPIEQGKMDITKIPKFKTFPSPYIMVSNETSSLNVSLYKTNSIEIPATIYQNLFLTKIVFDQLARAIEDLSLNEYSSHHVKYKVIDRFIRLCSELNIIDILFNPIMKCLRSKYYRDIFQTIELNQIRLNPKQLFFIGECLQFIIQHNLLTQERIANLLSKSFVETTKSIFDKYLSATDIKTDLNEDKDNKIFLHALSCHIEFLYHLSLTASTKQHFLQSSVINQLLQMFQRKELIINACQDEHLFNAEVAIIAYSLMLLSNLSSEKRIFTLLKQSYFKEICSQLHNAKDITIQFVSKKLSSILNEETINENNESNKLKEAYIIFIENIIIESKQAEKLGKGKNIEIRESRKKTKFVTESFMERLSRDIKDLANHDYPTYITKYKDVGRRIRVCTKEETDDVESLLDPIVTCLNSKYYLNAYTNIDINNTKASSIITNIGSNIAAKQLFFMNECPEFLMRHDYKRQIEIRIPLYKKMLEITDTILEQHLPVLTGNEKQTNFFRNINYENAQIEALSYHIKLLNHFTLTQAIRKEFSTTSIFNRIFQILESKMLVDNIKPIDASKMEIIRQCLLLLYNLSFDNQALSMMRTMNILQICSRLHLIKDETIQFASQTLAVILDPIKNVESITDPRLLTKTYIEYINKSVNQPRQPYQGVKLYGILKHLEIIIPNDDVQQFLIEEKERISSLTKCLNEELSKKSNVKMRKKIQRSSLNIVWKLLFYAPAASHRLKSIDQFMDDLHNLLQNESSTNILEIAKGIIWKLSNEQKFLHDQAEKKKEKKQDSHEERRNSEIEDQFITNDQWDDSVPFDLLVSFSNDLNIKSICYRICNRLIAKNFKVYIEGQSKHRLELITQGIIEQKILLVCLSSKYRTSKLCMAEIEYAYKNKCPIIPVILEANYKLKGWLNHLVNGKKTIDFTQKNFNENILYLIDEIERIKASD